METTNDINTEANIYDSHTSDKPGSRNCVTEPELGTSNTLTNDKSDTRLPPGTNTSKPPHAFNASSATSHMETNQTINDINTEANIYDPYIDSRNYVTEQGLGTSDTLTNGRSDTRCPPGTNTSTPPHHSNISSVTSPSDHTKKLEDDVKTSKILTVCADNDRIHRDAVGHKDTRTMDKQLQHMNKTHPDSTNSRTTVTLTQSIVAKSTGYRNKNSFVPVNQHTAIHLRRPANIVTETKSSPVLLPRPVKDVTAYKHANMHIPRPESLVNNVIPKQVQNNYVPTDRSITTVVSEPASRPAVVYPINQFNMRQCVPITTSLPSSTVTHSIHNANHQIVDPSLGNGDTKDNVNKLTSLLQDPKVVKKPKIDSTAQSIVGPTSMKCQNNNSKVKKQSPMDSSSSVKRNVSTSASSAIGLDHRETLRNKKCNKRQAKSDDLNDRNSSHTKVPNNKHKHNVLSTQKKDVSSYIALPSTSKCIDRLTPCDTPRPDEWRDQLADNKNSDEPSSITDAKSMYASEEGNAHSSYDDIKKRPKTVTKAETITKSNYETTMRANAIELLKKQHELAKHSPNINAIKHQCYNNSRSCYDLESRYLGTIDEEDLHNTDTSSDVIREVEAYKLSSVKDHRLLTLSDDEKVFLRSKSYLHDDATYDVKRCLTQKKIDTPVKSHRVSLRRNTKQESLNEQGCASSSVKQERYNESIPTATKGQQQLRTISSKTIPRDVNKTVVKSEITNSPRPVIRLQRIDNQIQMATISQTVGKLPENAYLPGNTDARNTANANKVYYVINKDDLCKIKAPEHLTMEQHENRIVPINASPGISSNMSSLIQQHSSQTLIGNRNSSYQAATKLPKRERAIKSKCNVNSKQHSSDCVKSGEHVKVLGNTYTTQQTMNKTPSSFVLNQKPLTVRELLALKRRVNETNQSCNDGLSAPTHMQVINVPIGVSDSETKILPITSVVLEDAYEKQVTTLTPTEELQASEEYLNNQPSTSRSYKESSQRLVRIVNPSNRIPDSNICRTVVTHNPSQSVYLEPFKTMSSSDKVRPQVVHEDKPIQIKVGEKTMIVCNRTTKDMKNRKTLPAPKPKHRIVNDYKRRKRRPSKSRVKENQRCLQAKLKKLLMKSEDSLHKLAQTLDLVPMDVLKQALTEPAAEFSAVVRNKSRAYIEDTMQVASTSEHLMDSPSHSKNSYRHEMCVVPPADIANVMQIFTDVNGVCSYSKHQVQIKYRHYGMPAADHTAQSEFPCRLTFDTDGILQKISIETIQQGLYLVNKKSIDLEFTRNIRVLNTTLIVYPPHAAVLPPGSLSIAVGDIFSSARKDRNLHESNGTGSIQDELQRFLWPVTMDNAEELIDRRYGSVTDRHLSPRCCSPRFYTEAMVHAFDRCGNVLESDPSSEDLATENGVSTRRLDGMEYNSDLQTIRSSERAMALKIRQNELLESCRKLKSLQTKGTEPKRKRRRVNKRDSRSTETTQQNLEKAVAELITCSEVAQQEDQEERLIGVLTETDAESQDIDVE